MKLSNENQKPKKKTKIEERYSYKCWGVKNGEPKLCDYSRSYALFEDALKWYETKGKWLEEEFNRKLIFKISYTTVSI